MTSSKKKKKKNPQTLKLQMQSLSKIQNMAIVEAGMKQTTVLHYEIVPPFSVELVLCSHGKTMHKHTARA